MAHLRGIASFASPNLPTEILSTIFLHCADSDGVLNSSNTIDMPLLLTKICSGWRSVAINTQSLWSRLFINIQPNSEHQATLASTWLERSGACPLQIYIIWQTPPFLDSHPVLDIIIQHSYHWRSMFIYLPFAAFNSLYPVRGNLPILSELSLGTDDDLITGAEISDAFEDAPELRSLECVNLNPDLFIFPWATLTKIPIMAVDAEDCIDILHHTFRLENGSFIITHGPSWPSKPPKALQHRRLQELAILTAPFSEGVDTRDVFQFLTLPNLRSLRICNVQSPLGPALVTFLSRIESLETLFLRRIAASDQELLQVLEMVPYLKHLTVLSSPTMTDHVLDQLIWKPCEETSSSSFTLLPKLETLELSIDAPMGVSLVDLLESRWDADESDEDAPRVARLKEVNVVVAGDLELDIMDELHRLAKAGMKIVIAEASV
ncbi:hypothetical protein BDZ94DRAFT_1248416 [Collybia nuda]|uniref:F-box domain-containing protein n=1 Tax=Collybia nuda TaxID=64659 RepID=A0A9P5YFE6_9AGAR|nr:hypothetical protein BDZ94DRAFT_1248416 [Collybia nuda]